MHILEHILFEFLEHPDFTLYALVSGTIMGSWQRSGWYFLFGWFILPFMLVGLALMAPLLLPVWTYWGFKHGWGETWAHIRNPKAYAKLHPTSPMVHTYARFNKRY